MAAAQDSETGLSLTGAQQTLLVTLLAKYNDFYQPRPLLADRWAVAVLDHLGASQHAWLAARIPRGPTAHPATVTMRTRTMDDWTADFLTVHRDEPVTVIHLACGLDARALRLRGRCGVAVRWVDLDLPDVIDARHRVAAAMPRPMAGGGYSYEMVAADATAAAWLRAIPADRPTLVIMEGLSMYLGVEAAKALIRRLVSHFAPYGGELVLDTLSPRFAALLNWVVRVQKHFDFQFEYMVRSPAEVLELDERLQLVEGYTFTDNPAVKLLGFWPRLFLWVMSWIPYAAPESPRYVRATPLLPAARKKSLAHVFGQDQANSDCTTTLPMPSLRNRLDQDVYHVVRRLEESVNDCKPFKTVSAAYNAIKTSNSSLGRQKKRPLEDALFRVLDVRKQEEALDESDDSEAAIDIDEPETAGDERFLLNRQLTKHWGVEPATMPHAASNGDQPAKKKRRVDTDGDERNTARATSEGATAMSTPKEPKEGKTADGSKLQKKTPRGPSFDVESNIETLQLGGLGTTYNTISTLVSKLLFGDRLGLYENPHQIRDRLLGLALTGPSYVGKTSYIRAIASDLNATLINITRCFQEPERIEKSLTEAFDTALASAPCIVYLKHIQHYMPKSGDAAQNDQHEKAFFTLQRQLERVKTQRARVVCMVTATQQSDVNPAVFSPDMIAEYYQLRVPNVEERRDILEKRLLHDTVHEQVNLYDLARKMDGCVGGDIKNLVRRAGEHAGTRLLAAQGLDHKQLAMLDAGDPEGDEEAASALPVEENPLTLEDFNAALADYIPTLRKEGFTAIPNVSWDQVGGLASVRAQLSLSIVGPITQPELYAKFGLTRAGGCLLWGPPGCGKTLIAQAVANEAQASFILINGPELLNKYVGESERAVRELFTRARSSTPCILFFDEFDSIAPRRDGAASSGAGTRVVNALLTELDGARDRAGIFVIGTTNRPDQIDDAILRPGRLSKQLFLDLPTAAERVEILRTIYRTRHVGASDDEFARLEAIARDARCLNFSGADLSGLHERAAEFALTRYLEGDADAPKEIRREDWEAALEVTRPSVNMTEYEKLKASWPRRSAI